LSQLLAQDTIKRQVSSGALHGVDGPPPFPDRVGRYELLVPIGSGGMATVYLARVRGVGGFERNVALKLLHAHLRSADGEPDATRQLIEEAKLVSRIQHANVAAVTDVGDAPSGVFLVMEYIEGETLATLFREAVRRGERIPPEIALRVLVDALAGLHAAHEARGDGGKPLHLVHRDFSPQNILVGTDGASRLTDFGIAKAVGGSAMTQTGFIKGKPAYMAPEQALGLPVDRRCDVWAASVVAWELFSGARLHPAREDASTLLRIVSTDPPRLRSAWPDAPPELDECIALGLRRDVEGRLPTAEVLRLQMTAAAGWRVADPTEVAEYVSSVAGPKIVERRRAAAETLARREAESSVGATVLGSDRKVARSRRAAFVLVGAGVLATVVVVAERASIARNPGAHAQAAAAPATALAPSPSTAPPSPAGAADAPAIASMSAIASAANPGAAVATARSTPRVIPNAHRRGPPAAIAVSTASVGAHNVAAQSPLLKDSLDGP
jgi:serine/threonine-protein kinase